MISDELRARIDADMARVPGMELGETLAFLAGYTARFDAEMRRGEVTRGQLRAYADAALERAHAEHVAAREAACVYPGGCESAHEVCNGCWNA